MHAFFLKNQLLRKQNQEYQQSNSFDPDQARHFVGPDLVPNCLQRLSTDDTSSEDHVSSSSLQRPIGNHIVMTLQS